MKMKMNDNITLKPNKYYLFLGLLYISNKKYMFLILDVFKCFFPFCKNIIVFPRLIIKFETICIFHSQPFFV